MKKLRLQVAPKSPKDCSQKGTDLFHAVKNM